jgi:hypothetical protein
MASADRSGGKRRSWRERFGRTAPAPDPDAWVALVSEHIDDPATGASEHAKRVAAALEEQAIEVQLRPYVPPDQPGAIPAVTGLSALRSVDDRIRVAVLVRRRDLERARAAATHVDHSNLEWHSVADGGGFSDEELTRLSMQGIEDPEQGPDRNR